MADNAKTMLAKLQVLDEEEDRIIDVLVRHGAALEEAQRQGNMVSVADLRPLRDGMAALEKTIHELQASLGLAEAAARPPAPSAQAVAGASNGHDATAAGSATTGTEVAGAQPSGVPPAPTTDAPAPPPADTGAPLPPSMTFEELAARISEQDAQATRLKELLRERLLTLGALSADPDAASERPDPVEIPLGHRTFKLRKQLMTGDDVKAFQHDLNLRFKAWGIKLGVSEDGVYGRENPARGAPGHARSRLGSRGSQSRGHAGRAASRA